MTEWTREERYQRIEDVDTEYFKTLKQQVDHFVNNFIYNQKQVY